MRRQLKILHDFIQRFGFVNMRPDNSVIKGGVPSGGTARALVEPGRAMAIYLRSERATGPWSARWTGSVHAPASGVYLFHTFSNDGIRLWINGTKVIEDWTDHSEKEDTGQIELEAGQRYLLKLEYFYNGGQGVSKLWWTPPAGKKEPVPTSALRTPTGTLGLHGEYFHGTDLARAWGHRDDPRVDFAWGTKPPFAGRSDSDNVPLQVQLSDGDWEAEWVDTKSGDVIRASRVSGGGVRALEVPAYEHDIALRLFRK